jgi:hypothetical protein
MGGACAHCGALIAGGADVRRTLHGDSEGDHEVGGAGAFLGEAAQRRARPESGGHGETPWGLGLLVICLFSALIMRATLTGGQHQAISGDAVHYIAMAENPLADIPLPFSLRTLTPAAVRAIHAVGRSRWDWDFAWITFTFMALLVACAFFRRLLLVALRVDGFTANVFTVCLIFNYCYSLFLFENPFLVDPLNNAFWAAALYWLFTDRYGRFMAVVALGAANKEAILILAPLYPLFMLLRHRTLLNRVVIRSLIATIGLGVLYLVYRAVMVQLLYGGQSASHHSGAQSLKDIVLFSLGFQKDVRQVYSVFHVFWFIAVVTLYELHSRTAWRNRYLVSSVYLLFTLGAARLFASDADRVFVMAAPLVLALGAAFCSARGGNRGSRFLLVLMFASVAQHAGWVHDVQTKILLDIGILYAFVTWLRRLDLGQIPAETLRELTRV